MSRISEPRITECHPKLFVPLVLFIAFHGTSFLKLVHLFCALKVQFL